MTNFCYINGKITPSDKAVIGINDIGLLRGYAAFDYLRTYKGRPFRIDDHLRRFRNSAESLHLPVKLPDDKLKSIIHELLAKSEVEEAGIRLILTGGYATDSMSIAEPNFIINIEPLPEYPNEIYKKGVKLITYEYQRNTPQSKTTEYLNAVRLEPLKREQNALDILYYYDEEVLEITRNNFFVFKDNILITPKDNVLLGITRKVVIELAAAHFQIEERKLLTSELAIADEAFLCGTTKKIVPVVQIDEHAVGDKRPGSNTRQLMHLFEEYACGN